MYGLGRRRRRVAWGESEDTLEEFVRNKGVRKMSRREMSRGERREIRGSSRMVESKHMICSAGWKPVKHSHIGRERGEGQSKCWGFCLFLRAWKERNVGWNLSGSALKGDGLVLLQGNVCPLYFLSKTTPVLIGTWKAESKSE